MIFDDKFVTIAMNAFQEKKDLETIIATLKKEGATQAQTTYAICKGLGMKLAEVDAIVLKSPSWSDQIDINLKVRDELAVWFQKDSDAG